jgi:hypothetical protein
MKSMAKKRAMAARGPGSAGGGRGPVFPAIQLINDPQGLAEKMFNNLRRGGEEFLHLLTVNPEIGETLVGHPSYQPVEPADRIILTQGTRIEVETFDDLHQHARRKRPLVALDQIEIGRRNPEHGRHRGLGEALAFAQPAQRGSGEKVGVSHNGLCKLIYRFTQVSAQLSA